MYNCEKCNYSCSKKFLWKQHLSTKKHKKNMGEIYEKLLECCTCGKKYSNRSGLWKHEKTCKKEDTMSEMVSVIKEQNKIIKEMLPLVGNNNNNNNNKQFNINFYLNSECKNALNMSDFIKKLPINFDDLLYTKEKGIAESVSKLFLTNLYELEKVKRPIHCIDPKQQVMYIKEDDKWKNDMSREILKNVMQTLVLKQQRALINYNPNNYSNDDYIKIVQQLMKENKDDRNKFITNIANNTLLDH